MSLLKSVSMRFISRRTVLFLALTCAFSALLFTNTARADQVGEAKNFIQGLGDKAIATLSDKSITPEEAGKTFRKMLVDSFDLDLIGKFAIGANSWKSASSSQRQDYLKLFEQLVVQIYSDRFSLYNGEKWKVVDAKAEDDRDSYVSGQILKANPGAPPVEVDWRVRNKGGKPQVIDVIVEGVSMSVTQRSEFAAVLQKNGGDFGAFLKTLGERVSAAGAQAKN